MLVDGSTFEQSSVTKIVSHHDGPMEEMQVQNFIRIYSIALMKDFFLIQMTNCDKLHLSDKLVLFKKTNVILIPPDFRE